MLSERGDEPKSNAYFVEPEWSGTFSQYLDIVRAMPTVAETAHHRLWRMVMSRGKTGTDGRKYPFFTDSLFGIEETVTTLVEDYLRPAARGFEVKKRILLLVGPISGGKSTLVTLLKRGLEAFTSLPEGQLFGIKGCPMHEEPLHLIPAPMRSEWERDLGVKIEGELCPVCQWHLANTYQGRIGQVPVERVILSEYKRIGVGTYAPSDPKSQDIADLTGAVDFQGLAHYGSESDPRAFRFDGELNIANRGLVEFQEMLKLDEKFLYQLLSLSQEGNMKTTRFQLISADEVIIGHTNEHEFRTFMQNPRNEALLSRMFVIPVPYNLNVSEEVRIYQKLLAPYEVPEIHKGPGALQAAAEVAILSRIKELPKPGRDRLSKLLLYQSEDNDHERKMAQDEGRQLGEGMTGLDPRYLINRLSALFSDPDRECVDALDVLDAIRSGLDNSPFGDRGLRTDVQEWTQTVKTLYDQHIEKLVLQAFAEDWSDELERLYRNYLDHVIRFVEDTQGDEQLLRSIEERLAITETQAPAFREEIYARVKSSRGRSSLGSYHDYPHLRQALEQKLFDDLRDMVKITTQSLNPDPKTLQRIEQAAQNLVAHHGFCPRCATKAIHHVGGLLNR
ncbi:protein prkA [Sulfobacillus thermosulfidooxidans]|uniref:protein prkA n=1 Tax=Sulfobacillus thermosulfidooxidans TaxID=28034 RepID=UPI00096B7D66|nr:protein prkA [Sulfobacillus thermosulfidooxidans]OLZ09754.1 protein prkA [Sulfobacillus thermosulfidooxidans]OLZ15939.1 protein prkA [Sulfobacillus thermosulfidooxidans]OLZ18213.1 protein prkA [Sulfobacillus thermosulfidooxidans]